MILKILQYSKIQYAKQKFAKIMSGQMKQKKLQQQFLRYATISRITKTNPPFIYCFNPQAISMS